VARPKGKKLHFSEPTLVVARHLENGLGYLKVAMFPGMVGVEVATAFVPLESARVQRSVWGVIHGCRPDLVTMTENPRNTLQRFALSR
jgi:hypothetical protein